jgi:hypothetical protein
MTHDGLDLDTRKAVACFDRSFMNRIAQEAAERYSCIAASCDQMLVEPEPMHLPERQYSSGSVPLTAAGPTYFAEPFGITDYEVILQAATAQLCFDRFAHIADDLADAPRERQCAEMHAGILLLARGFGICNDVSSGSAAVQARLEMYLADASAGERFLWRHHGVARPYSDVDFAMLGRRGALAKVAIALYAGLTNRWDTANAIEKAVDSAVTGIQLTDDYVDWLDDLRSGIYTYPLLLAQQRTGSFDEAKTACALLSPAVGGRVLARCGEHLEVARDLFAAANARAAAEALEELLVVLLGVRHTLEEYEAGRRSLGAPGDAMRAVRRVLVPRMQH